MSTKQKIVTANGTIRTSKRKIDASDIQLYTLCLIPLLALFIFNYIPMFGVVLAFKDYNYQDGIWGSAWVGFKNFEFFFKSDVFVELVRNTLFNNFLFIIAGILSALTVAILLYELKSRLATKIFQTILITPHFMSWVIVAYMVLAILNTSDGFLNRILISLGISSAETAIDWYSKPNAWPIILTICSVWHAVGMDSVVYYASLMGIDSSLFEAAEVDGANKWQRIINIVLPSLVPIIVILTILKIGSIFRADFGLFYNVTMDGASGNLYSTTNVIDTYTFRLFSSSTNSNVGNSYGLATAVSLLQSIVGMILVISTNAASKRIDSDLGLF